MCDVVERWENTHDNRDARRRYQRANMAPEVTAMHLEASDWLVVGRIHYGDFVELLASE